MNTRKIVIVEDNSEINELYTMAFSADGYEVQSYLDGVGIEEKILKFKPNIVLLDIMMPKIDGLELLKRLKSSSALDFLIIVSSNLVNDSIKKEVLRLGATDFFNKSDYTPTTIVEKVSEYLGGTPSQTQNKGKEECPYTILIIDDNKDELELLSMFFKEKGCNVITALGGVEGITKIVENHPDLVLADIVMKDMNGFELLKEVKENINFKVNIMMMSEIDDSEKIQKSKDLGAIDYIKKSEYSQDQIVEKVMDYFQCDR